MGIEIEKEPSADEGNGMQYFSVLSFKIIAEPESVLLSVLLDYSTFIFANFPGAVCENSLPGDTKKLNIRQVPPKHLYRFIMPCFRTAKQS